MMDLKTHNLLNNCILSKSPNGEKVDYKSKHVNQGRKEVIIEPRDWVWLLEKGNISLLKEVQTSIKQ